MPKESMVITSLDYKFVNYFSVLFVMLMELQVVFPAWEVDVGDEDLLLVLRFFSQLKNTKLINSDALEV